MSDPTFDAVATEYDLLTDWARRLPGEIAFLDRLLRANGASRVLDAACGTGAHLEALADLGYRVTGADLSPAMVARARARVPAAAIHEAPFVRAGDVVSGQDAVLVLGNSLPLAGDEAAVGESLAGLARALRPGGVLVLHMLNFVRLAAEGGGLRPPRRVASGGKEYTFLKIFDVRPGEVTLSLVTLVSEGDAQRASLARSTLCPLTRDTLDGLLRRAGLAPEAWYGGFDGSPHDETRSGDLVSVSRRVSG